MPTSTASLVRRALACAAVACGAALAAAPTPAAALPAAATVTAPSAVSATTAKRATKARSSKASRKTARRATRRAAARSARRSASRTRTTRRTHSVRTRSVRTRRASAALDLGDASGVTLRGSRAAVDRAYDEAQSEGLTFASSRREIERGAAEGDYVSLRGGSWRLKGVTAPYARPETRAFLVAFAPLYANACGEPLTVTSAMRPTSLHLRNSVAKTVHPTGIAVDLRAPRSGCRGWMRSALLGYERRGVVEATEERHPAHFHVAVLRAP